MKPTPHLADLALVQRTPGPSPQAVPERIRVLDCVNTALAQEKLSLAATAVAGELARAFACEHVVVGFLRGQVSRVTAWSGTTDLRQEFQLVRRVSAAMDEALDQHSTLRYPPQADDPPRITLMHAELASDTAGALLTLPLPARGRAIGALTLMRRADRPWQVDEILALEKLVTTIGPVLELKLLSQESAWVRLRHDIRDFTTGLTSSGHVRSKFVVLGLALLIAALTLIPVTENVTANARTEGQIQRSLSAPADSFLQEVFVHPGDSVKQGQVLLRLADEELLTQQRRLEAELAQAQSEMAEAFARQDRSRMVGAQAKTAETGAALSLVAQQLARTSVLAPFDGVIIKGDLQQLVGAPVKRGDPLLTLAPNTAYRVVLQVEDRDVAQLRAGMQGALTLSAMPGESLPILIERVTPVAQVEDGRNVFEVRARLLGGHAGLRPGLEGVAKIGLGRAPLAQVAGSRLVDWLRFQSWKLLG